MDVCDLYFANGLRFLPKLFGCKCCAVAELLWNPGGGNLTRLGAAGPWV